MPDHTDRAELAEVIDLRCRMPGARSRPEHNGPAPSAAVQPTSAAEADATRRTALEDAVRALAKRQRSTAELRRELFALGHDDAETEQAVRECQHKRYLDDLDLARTLVERMRERGGVSRATLHIKMRERLLPEDIVTTALNEQGEDEEYEMLSNLARTRARRLADLDRRTAERRLLGFLARRGWSGELARQAARDALHDLTQ